MRWTLFDLNGTLLDPSGVAGPLGGGEEDRRLVGAAFRDALLLTMADTLSGGAYRPLSDYLRATLERGLRAAGRATDPLDAAMNQMGALDPFPHAAGALEVLENRGLRTGVLTNSPADSAERSLERVGLRDRFEVVIGTDAVGVFKPHPRVYRHAVERLGVEPAEVCLVSAHGWDVTGAMRAGMRAAWVAHTERWLVPTVADPDFRGHDLEDVARQIVAGLA